MDTTPHEDVTADEFEMHDGHVWTAFGPRGKSWTIAYQPDRDADNMRAWPNPAGRTAYFDHAADLADARAKAQDIANLIKAGKRRTR